VRLDVTVPEGVLAAQPYLRLGNPGEVTDAGELMADDLHLVRWSTRGNGGRLFDMVRFGRTTDATLTVDGR
jgi:hypothetical protein